MAHNLNTMHKKPGAIRNSVALKSAPKEEDPATQSLWSPKPLPDEARIAIDDSQIDMPVFPKLFTDFYMMYAKREKSFAWEDVVMDFETAGYMFVYTSEDSYGFMVFPHYDNFEDYGASMACGFTTDENPDAPPFLSKLGYYANLDFEGVIVEFRNGRDKYYIDDSTFNLVEVKSLEDTVDYLVGLMTG